MTKCNSKCRNECKKLNNNNNNNNNNVNNINNKRNTIPLKYVYLIIGISSSVFIISLFLSIYYLFLYRKGWVTENAELINEEVCDLKKHQKCYHTIKININGKEYIKQFITKKELKITEIDGKRTIKIDYDPTNPRDKMELFVNKELFKIIIALILFSSFVIVVYFFIYKYYKIIKGINKIKIDHDLFM